MIDATSASFFSPSLFPLWIAHQVLDEQPSRSSRVQLSAFFVLPLPSSLPPSLPPFTPSLPSLPFFAGLVLLLSLCPLRSPPIPRIEHYELLQDAVSFSSPSFCSLSATCSCAFFCPFSLRFIPFFELPIGTATSLTIVSTFCLTFFVLISGLVRRIVPLSPRLPHKLQI
ncbi:hypothetical protein ACTXT7_017351 [Hymenolepis weldensis]